MEKAHYDIMLLREINGIVITEQIEIRDQI